WPLIVSARALRCSNKKWKTIPDVCTVAHVCRSARGLPLPPGIVAAASSVVTAADPGRIPAPGSLVWAARLERRRAPAESAGRTGTDLDQVRPTAGDAPG